MASRPLHQPRRNVARPSHLPHRLCPLGCLLHLYISLHLNGRMSFFPLGNFTVNIAGTMILGMLFDFQHSALTGAGVGAIHPTYHHLLSCQAPQGIYDGFCECLTTVST
jgi:fluoride ion exporter CrcB/FEX